MTLHLGLLGAMAESIPQGHITGQNKRLTLFGQLTSAASYSLVPVRSVGECQQWLSDTVHVSLCCTFMLRNSHLLETFRQDFVNSRLAVCHNPRLSCSWGAASHPWHLPSLSPPQHLAGSLNPRFQLPDSVLGSSFRHSLLWLYWICASFLTSQMGGGDTFYHVWALSVLTELQPRRMSSRSF